MAAKNYQLASDKKVKRGNHVWYEKLPGKFKCVLCGGLSDRPDDHSICTAYEELTAEERAMCPAKR